ncbi:MAG: DUF4224 domain-containing protein [Rhodothermales bacterium]|nr:DUF4224 domain-containing protein [Rhodothermales bacterium]
MIKSVDRYLTVFLTRDDIISLTGRKRLKSQTAWLIEHRYPFDINSAGLPVVLRSVVERKLGGVEEEKRSARPRFEELHRG